MTAVWRSGAEIPSLTLGEFSTGSGATFDTTYKRSGTSSLRYTGSGYLLTRGGLNLSAATQRAYLAVSATPTTATRIMGLLSQTGHLASLRLLTDRRLELNLNGPPAAMTALATSSFTIPTGTWEPYVELWVDRTAKVVAARYNGLEWARVAVSTFADANTIDAGFFGPDEAGAGVTLSFDDMAINSLAGAHNNGWCGPSAGGVLTFWPTANAELTASTWVVSGAGSVYEAMDELTPDENTSYIAELTGTENAVAGVYFPAWPLRTPASCMLLGVRGGGVDAMDGAARLEVHDAADQGIAATVNWNLNGYKTVYPMLTLEEAWDGTRRMLNNGYLYPSAHPGLFPAGTRTRVLVIRSDALIRPIRITTLWMTVDFPLALTPTPALPPTPAPAILTTIQTTG